MSATPQTTVSLADVLARADVWRGDRLANSAFPALASGFAELDAQLPGNGWPRGTLTEILSPQSGIGECSLLLPALSRLGKEGLWTLLVHPPQALHAKAWSAAGIDLSRLLVVAPQDRRDALWATEQALSSGALGSVLCWADDINAAQVRRLEVAVAGQPTLAFVFRPTRAQNEASASSLRLRLAAGDKGKLAVNLLKRRGPPCARTLLLDIARPLHWRNNDEDTLARHPFALPAARSTRDTVAA